MENKSGVDLLSTPNRENSSSVEEVSFLYLMMEETGVGKTGNFF